MPENSLIIDDFELKSVENEEKGTKFIASLPIQAKDLDSATMLAKEKFEKLFNALTLSTGGGYDYELTKGTEITPRDQIEKGHHIGFISTALPFSKILDLKKTEQVSHQTKEILRLLQKTDTFSKKAMDYFIIGTNLSRWPNEAFLNFFKVIELISDKFFSEFKRGTRKEKILNACSILGMEGVNEKVMKIVDIRNSFDVAHPTLNISFKKDYVEPCRGLAREIIIRYLRIQKQYTNN